MIERLTIDGVEYERILLSHKLQDRLTCDCCDFVKLPFCEEPCTTCISYRLGTDNAARRYTLRKVTKTKE